MTSEAATAERAPRSTDHPMPSGASGGAYAVVCHNSLDAVPANQLSRVAYPAQDNVFLSAQWFRCLAEHGFPQDRRPRVYLANDAHGAPACFLFCAAAGTTLHGLSNFYTMEFAASFADGGAPDPRILANLARFIAAERPRWHRIALTGLRADRPATGLLADALSAEGFAINRYFQFQNWYCGTEGQSFEDYYAARPSRLKNTIKRKEKKMRREHDIAIRIEDTITDAGIADWATIYAKSWKEKEQFPGFMPNLMRACAALGILRFGTLHVDGEPAAAQVWINSGRRTIIYKLAYDEKFASWSVGSVLTRDMMRRALDQDRIIEVDYGVGSEAYKRDWMTGCRDIIGIEGFNTRSPIGLCLAVKSHLTEAVKRLMAPAEKSDTPS